MVLHRLQSLIPTIVQEELEGGGAGGAGADGPGGAFAMVNPGLIHPSAGHITHGGPVTIRPTAGQPAGQPAVVTMGGC